jgi:MFS family permease
VGVALLAGFAWWERRAPHPLLPPRLLHVRGFAAGNVAVALTVAPLFSAVFFYGQLLQVVVGHDALGAGVRLMAWTGTLLLVAPAAGALADRIGERPLIVAGLSLQAAAMLWFALVVDVDVSFLDALGPFVVGGLGVSLAIPGGQSAAVASVADRDVATAAGVNSTVRQLGGVLGIAVTVAVFGAAGGFATPEDFVDGFRAAMLTAAGLSALGALVGLTLPARRANARDDTQAPGSLGSGSLEGAAA